MEFRHWVSNNFSSVSEYRRMWNEGRRCSVYQYKRAMARIEGSPGEDDE